MARYDQCDSTCTVDCGHCKGAGRPTAQHFAIGLVVTIRPGAKPVGWGDDEPFTDDVYGLWREIKDVHPSEPGNPLGSFEVSGWNWAPTDLSTRG